MQAHSKEDKWGGRGKGKRHGDVNQEATELPAKRAASAIRIETDARVSSRVSKEIRRRDLPGISREVGVLYSTSPQFLNFEEAAKKRTRASERVG